MIKSDKLVKKSYRLVKKCYKKWQASKKNQKPLKKSDKKWQTNKKEVIKLCEKVTNSSKKSDKLV